MQEFVKELARQYNLPEFLVVFLLVLLLIWILAWIFLPFALWGLKERVDSINKKVDNNYGKVYRMEEQVTEIKYLLNDILGVLKQMKSSNEPPK